MSDRLTRIAIVSADKCKPKKCRQECKKSCPVVKTGIIFDFLMPNLWFWFVVKIFSFFVLKFVFFCLVCVFWAIYITRLCFSM
uniref:Putative ovule protein n=1 Tax=Solanum chacoense TaxID=4108 RepID=A0A0V0H1M5_SOLCH